MTKEKLQLRDAVELVVGDKDTDSIHSGATHDELHQVYASLREATHDEFIQVLANGVGVLYYAVISIKADNNETPDDKKLLNLSL